MKLTLSARKAHAGQGPVVKPVLVAAVVAMAIAVAWSLSAHEPALAALVVGLPLAYLATERRLQRQGARLQAEYEETARRLIEEESRYRTLVESSPVGIFHYDTTLRVTHANTRFAEMLHATVDALKDVDMTKLHDRRILVPLQAALEGRSDSYDGEYVATVSGVTLWITLRAAPVLDANGKISGGVAIVEDNTSRHAAEVMLRESEARYALAMRGTNEGLWDWNPLTHELFLSSRLLSALGEQSEHLRTTDDGWLKRIHDDDRPLFRAALIAHLKGQTPYFECEYRVLDKHGHYRWILARGLAQRDAGGIAYRMVGSIGDITERKHAEAALRDVNRELETRVAERTAQLGTALKELESFSYSVSHDLRAPLRAIDGYSAILASEYSEGLDGDAPLLLGRIRAAVHRMSDLIDDLLQLSRVSRHSLKREDVNLSALAQSVVHSLREAEPERQVDIRIDPDLCARGDSKLLRIAFENLFGNAWKFTAHTAGAQVRFGRCVDHEGRNGYFIEDNGAGFDMRYVDKLFAPFQRLHHEREFGGTGIGLATVARIVERHGGRISGSGEPGKGARFVFSLGEG